MTAEIEQILVVRKVKAASIYKLLLCGLLRSGPAQLDRISGFLSEPSAS